MIHSISHEGVLYFPNMTEIPPKAKLWIVIYGSFHETPLGTPIKAHASVKKIKIEREQQLSGYTLFLGSYSKTILVVILFIALLAGLRRVKNG